MTTIDMADPRFAAFLAQVKKAFAESAVKQAVGNKSMLGFPPGQDHPIWLRDHTYQMRGSRYFEPDIQSVPELFAALQNPDGSIYDSFSQTGEPERVPCEADVEYLLVESMYQAWQSAGNDAWLAAQLPAMEKALHYSMSSDIRWSTPHQLVKRPFTVDTWDFQYNPMGKYKRKSSGDIDENSTYCIMHGDNSGMYQATNHLAKLYRHLGRSERADYWQGVAAGFRERTNRLCWNGNFYTHQIHIDPVEVQGVDESRQLSLSNAFNLNRGIADFSQCCSMIEEYQKRRAEAKHCFAEWFGIHPPFPDYSFHSPDRTGAWVVNTYHYTNGGIFPLIGGELARGAFENGFETYGLDILERYFQLVNTTGAYVWYFPDGRPGTGFKPPDVWGLAAMLTAMIEGLLGVRDEHKLFEEVVLAPRLVVARVPDAKVRIEYAASGAWFDYTYALDQQHCTLTLRFEGNHTRKVSGHLLLPPGKRAEKVLVDGKPAAFTNQMVRQSAYVDFSAAGRGKIVVTYSGKS